MENWTNAKLCDVANLILGAVLFFSPWMFGFDAGKASENANIAGIVIAVLAIGPERLGGSTLNGRRSARATEGISDSATVTITEAA